jgi:DNA-binding winged helix-turn-helix (wHTH) protein/TolB-like protein
MLFKFGVFEFESDSGALTKNGRAVALEPQPARALGCLLAKAGEVVTREELRDAVWGAGTHVDFDRGLAYCLSQIRFALGDSGENPRFVQTLPKKGYRFIAPVADASGASSASGASGASSASGESGASRALAGRSRADVFRRWQAIGYGVVAVAALVGWFVSRPPAAAPALAVIAVSIFDNETGQPEHDRLVAGLSDLVVARLTALDPARIAVVGNAAVLRQPRNIRNLQAVAAQIDADYVLLGQLQRGEAGLRFITHFIRLADLAHLKANRLVMADGGVSGLEDAVVEEFTRAVAEHVLSPRAKSLQ